MFNGFLVIFGWKIKQTSRRSFLLEHIEAPTKKIMPSKTNYASIKGYTEVTTFLFYYQQYLP